MLTTKGGVMNGARRTKPLANIASFLLVLGMPILLSLQLWTGYYAATPPRHADADVAVHGVTLLSTGRMVMIKPKQPLPMFNNTTTVDYGGLSLVAAPSSQSSNNFGRRIDPRDDQKYASERSVMLESMDNVTVWIELKEYATLEDGIDEGILACHPPKWRSNMFPTCNTVHEATTNLDEKQFLG